jgi:hypothetical protein
MPKQARIKPSVAIRHHKKQCAVFNATMIHWDVDLGGVPREKVQVIAKELERQFNLWWDSWIEPELDYLEKRHY